MTGDPEFYTKIIEFMGTRPDEYAKNFDEAYAKAENAISKHLGHASADITSRVYAHMLAGTQTRIAKTISGLLN